MNTLKLIAILILMPVIVAAQKQKRVLQKKGFLFITAHNYRYDWDGQHMRPLGFHDFFFPTQNFDSTTLQDSTLYTAGIRVDSILQRSYVKEKSLKFEGVDSSHCYNYSSFYIVPVQISYREIEEYEPLVCRKSSFSIQQGLTKRIFYYEKRAIVITDMLLYPNDKKKAERL